MNNVNIHENYNIYENCEPEDDKINDNISICSICLEHINLPIYPIGIRLFCGHLFHRDCILPWFQKIETSTCPYCRKSETTVEEAIYSMRSVLNRYGMKNLKSPIIGQDFKPVWKWLLDEKRVYDDYRDIIFLIHANKYKALDELAQKAFQILHKNGYYKKIGNQYAYQP